MYTLQIVVRSYFLSPKLIQGCTIRIILKNLKHIRYTFIINVDNSVILFIIIQLFFICTRTIIKM